jgi:AraC-like DNA-binding protein
MTGMTPHQYVLRSRLHRAAVRLRLSDEPISAIAFDAGFNDLSHFQPPFQAGHGRDAGRIPRPPSRRRCGRFNLSSRSRNGRLSRHPPAIPADISSQPLETASIQLI